MIKSVGLLQRREDLDHAGFRAPYERNHVPLATKLLGFPGYQRNYPESDRAQSELGLDGFSEFWFQDAAQIAHFGELMRGDIGAELIRDELRFMIPSRIGNRSRVFRTTARYSSGNLTSDEAHLPRYGLLTLSTRWPKISLQIENRPAEPL